MEQSNKHIGYGKHKDRNPTLYFQRKRIYIPINRQNSHWVFVVVEIEKKLLVYYDFMGTLTGDKYSTELQYVEAILAWIEEHAYKVEQRFVKEEWDFNFMGRNEFPEKVDYT